MVRLGRKVMSFRVLAIMLIVASTFMAMKVFLTYSESHQAVVPQPAPVIARARNVHADQKTVESFVADRSICMPDLLADTYFHKVLTEAALHPWVGIKEGPEKWMRMAITYTAMWMPYFYQLHPYPFMSDGEIKYFVDFLDRRDSCNVITIGIGGTVDGEMDLFQRYPQCDFLGVDPDAKVNRPLVESIPRARFVEAAVGAKTETRVASLLEDPLTQVYSEVVVNHTGFVDLLRKHNGKRLVDLMILDVEGAEFGILPLLYERAADLPTICQMNLEVHTWPETYGYKLDDFFVHFVKLMRDGRYLPVHVFISDPAKYLRFVLLNIKDEECITKFHCS